MGKMRYFIGGTSDTGMLGVIGTGVLEAYRADCPFDPPFHFTEATKEEYENTVFDYRFEDGEWTQ